MKIPSKVNNVNYMFHFQHEDDGDIHHSQAQSSSTDSYKGISCGPSGPISSCSEALFTSVESSHLRYF